MERKVEDGRKTLDEAAQEMFLGSRTKHLNTSDCTWGTILAFYLFLLLLLTPVDLRSDRKGFPHPSSASFLSDHRVTASPGLPSILHLCLHLRSRHSGIIDALLTGGR